MAPSLWNHSDERGTFPLEQSSTNNFRTIGRSHRGSLTHVLYNISGAFHKQQEVTYRDKEKSGNLHYKTKVDLRGLLLLENKIPTHTSHMIWQTLTSSS